jgi:hypothetical protein
MLNRLLKRQGWLVRELKFNGEGVGIVGARLDSLILRLDQYIQCETAITTGSQDYTIGSRKLTRANLKEISDMILYLEKEIEIEKSKEAGKGRNRMVGIIPRDF